MNSKQGQSAAMPSPFTPIADYGFLSDCHTGALVAPDGGVDWLCVPRFDSASVFGSLLDREAGTFRFGPFGINVPTQRVYEAGTNVLMTTWKTPSGWVVVRDALTIGPTSGPDTVTPHTRPPADDDAEHVLVRTAECIDGEVEIELVCEPVFDYGDIPASWTLVDGSAPHGRRHRAGADAPPAHRHGPRCRGRAGPCPPHAPRWATGSSVRCRGPTAWRHRRTSTTRRGASTTTVAFWRNWLDRARIPDHRWRDPIQRSALAIKGLTYMPTGATVAALTTSLPETPGGERNWDYRYTLAARFHVHAAGAALAQPRLGGRRVHAVRRRSRGQRGRRPADHVRDRRPARPDGVDVAPPERLRRSPPGAGRQRRLRSTPERRLRRRPRLDPPAHAPQPASPSPALAAHPGAGRVRVGRLARARSGHLGGSRQAPALRVVEADVLGGARSRRQARPRSAGPATSNEKWACDRRRDPRRHREARSQRPRRAASALRDRRAWTPPRCWPRSSGSCPATTSGRTTACWRSPTTSPRTASCCATAPTRPTTGCRARRARS